MSGKKGRSGRPRASGERWPCGRLIDRDRCACGGLKSRQAQHCQTCQFGRQRKSGPRDPSGRLSNRCLPCACGGLKYRSAQRCKACDIRRRHAAIARRCEWCQQVFFRHRKGGDKHDALRFCSKACYGRNKSKRAIRQLHALERRIHRASVKQAQRARKLLTRSVCRRCDAPIDPHQRFRWCASCYSAMLVEKNSQAKDNRRTRTGALHVCPNCGQTFMEQARVVYCSRRCLRQMVKRRERGSAYPVLAGVPLDQRNPLAELVAMVRTTQRRLHDHTVR